MKVVYPGHMKGYHVVGRRGVALTPGVNDVDEMIGRALIASEIVLPIEETHHREVVVKQDESESWWKKSNKENDGRAEGAE